MIERKCISIFIDDEPTFTPERTPRLVRISIEGQ